jgi:predicted phosphoribosyltransferase
MFHVLHYLYCLINKKVDKNQDTLLILGIPRGGVVVADIVFSKLKSSSFNCDFDIIIPRKLGAPGNQEIAIGAIMMEEEDEALYINEDFIKELEGQNKNTEYIIKDRLQEKDEQIKSLTDQFSSMENILENLVEGLSETKDQQRANTIAQSLFSSGMLKPAEP